jgi:molecular chaperone DnaK
VTIKVAQGERELFQYNKLLGEFNLDGIPPARRGQPQIEVTFDIDANGILKVHAKDKATNKENNITIKANSGLSEAEIEQMVKDAELNAEADKKQRELIEKRNSAEGFMNEARTDLGKYGDKITEEEKTKLTEAMTALEESVKGDDAEAIQTKTHAFMEALGPLTNVKYKAENPEPEAKPTEGTAPADVVDADVQEVKPGN